MTLIISDDLATRWVLEADGMFLIDRAGAVRQGCLVAMHAQSDDALPAWTWRSHVHLLVAAWLDLAVYQPASFSENPEILPLRSEIPSRPVRPELPSS